MSPFRGSITSYTKVSRNSSFRFDTQTSIGSPPVSPGSGSGKTVSVFRSLMTNLKRSETEDEGSGANLDRVTSKNSRRSHHLDVIRNIRVYIRSGLSVTSSGMEQETVKFKLVEDLSLVTIPITTCLLVLLGIITRCFVVLYFIKTPLGYILFGAALFSVWEVTMKMIIKAFLTLLTMSGMVNT